MHLQPEGCAMSPGHEDPQAFKANLEVQLEGKLKRNISYSIEVTLETENSEALGILETGTN